MSNSDLKHHTSRYHGAKGANYTLRHLACGQIYAQPGSQKVVTFRTTARKNVLQRHQVIRVGNILFLVQLVYVVDVPEQHL
ncbi:hypothetical protein D3C84_994470 [compost metagenome]